MDDFEKEIKCTCGKIYETKDFEKHFMECPKFKECFNSFNDTLSKLINSYFKPKEQLLLMKFLFNQYIKKLDKKIEQNYSEISKGFHENLINVLQDSNLNSNNYESNYLSKKRCHISDKK